MPAEKQDALERASKLGPEANAYVEELQRAVELQAQYRPDYVNQDPATIAAMTREQRCEMWAAQLTAFNEATHQNEYQTDAHAMAVEVISPIRELVSEKLRERLNVEDPNDHIIFLAAQNHLDQVEKTITNRFSISHMDENEVARIHRVALLENHHNRCLSEAFPDDDDHLPYSNDGYILKLYLDTVNPLLNDGTHYARDLEHPTIDLYQAYRDAALNHLDNQIPDPEADG